MDNIKITMLFQKAWSCKVGDGKHHLHQTWCPYKSALSTSLTPSSLYLFPLQCILHKCIPQPVLMEAVSPRPTNKTVSHSALLVPTFILSSSGYETQQNLIQDVLWDTITKQLYSKSMAYSRIFTESAPRPI